MWNGFVLNQFIYFVFYSKHNSLKNNPREKSMSTTLCKKWHRISLLSVILFSNKVSNTPT